MSIAGRIPDSVATPRSLPFEAIEDDARLADALNSYPYLVRLEGGAADEDSEPASAALTRLAGDCAPELTLSRIEIDATAAADAVKSDATRQSRTADAMSPHTDSTFMPDPHEVIAFQFVRTDSTGGESVFVALDDVLRATSAEDIETLKSLKAPFGRQTAPILEETEDGLRVRFNMLQLAKSRGPDADAALYEAAERFEAAALAAPRISFRAEPGEVVIFNNRRLLHARSALAKDSDRLMLRLRARSARVG